MPGLVFGAGKVVALGISYLPPDLALLSHVQGEQVQPPSKPSQQNCHGVTCSSEVEVSRVSQT